MVYLVIFFFDVKRMIDICNIVSKNFDIVNIGVFFVCRECLKYENQNIINIINVVKEDIVEDNYFIFEEKIFGKIFVQMIKKYFYVKFIVCIYNEIVKVFVISVNFIGGYFNI